MIQKLKPGADDVIGVVVTKPNGDLDSTANVKNFQLAMTATQGQFGDLNVSQDTDGNNIYELKASGNVGDKATFSATADVVFPDQTISMTATVDAELANDEEAQDILTFTFMPVEASTGQQTSAPA